MNNNHGSKELRLCLVVKFLFNTRIADKDVRAHWEIIILDRSGKALDEFCCRLFPSLQDSCLHLKEIFQAFLKLLGAIHIRSSVDAGAFKGGRKYVTSAMSSRRTASIPWA